MNIYDVKGIRKRLKLSRSELAEKIGVSKRTVESWEQGLRGMSEESAKKLEELAKEVTHG
jgi:DNA-binding transcriptional regulator YiaG